MELPPLIDYDLYLGKFHEAERSAVDWDLQKEWDAQGRHCEECERLTKELVDQYFDGTASSDVRSTCAKCSRLMGESAVEKWAAAGRKCAHCGRLTALPNEVLCSSCLKTNLARPKPADKRGGDSYSDLVSLV